MIKSEVNLRVRYAETDRMGYVYHGNYAQYFEVARVEMLRELGFNYKSLEDDGVLLPVVSLDIRFFKPAYYDDLLTIRTEIRIQPTSRIVFHYKTYNQQNEQLNEASTTLVFMNAGTKRPCRVPIDMQAVFESFFTG